MQEKLEKLRMAREQGDEKEFLLIVLLGVREAVKFIQDLAFVSQVWDDLVDGDKVPTPEQVTAAFIKSLVELPRNAFYMQHFAVLNPLMESAIQCWLDANELERGNSGDRVLAFVLRDRLGDLVSACAGIVGGLEWQRMASVEIRRMAHVESLGDYLRGLREGGCK